MIVDSSEWPGVPDVYSELVPYFERSAWSDITWARTLGWRRELARLWPGIAGLRELRIAGPVAEATLLAGWLRSRLHREVELVVEQADSLEAVAVDGTEVDLPELDAKSPSDLLSDELDRFGRDPVYEGAARAAGVDFSLQR